jgi:hypothetical protein
MKKPLDASSYYFEGCHNLFLVFPLKKKIIFFLLK